MPSSGSVARREARPKIRSVEQPSSNVVPRAAAISGGTTGTLYSSRNSATVVSQLAIFVSPAFRNALPTARRKSSCWSERGKRPSSASTLASRWWSGGVVIRDMAVEVIRWHPAEQAHIERGVVVGVLRAIQRPLEPGDVRQVGEVTARREVRQEVRERLAVLEEARAGRRMRRDEAIGRIREEARIHEPADDRIHGLQQIAERVGNVMAVDREPRLARQAVAADVAEGGGGLVTE